MAGKTTIAAHVDHLHFGLALLNRWAVGEANPWAGETELDRGLTRQVP
jgi:hypothetical protein